MRNFNTNIDNNDTWLTPPWIIESLGEFDLDPCTPEVMPWKTAKVMYSKEKDGDGLTAPWFCRVWCNPPYGRETFKWLDKLADHCKNGGRGTALIFARTETVGFHEHVFNKAHSILFLKGRLKFHKADGTAGGTANAPSCLISYSEFDTNFFKKAIDLGQIKGYIVYLSKS